MVLLIKLLATACCLAGASGSPTRRQIPSYNWGTDKIRGVNIGGWLVLEPWITPSIFQQLPVELGVVDEYTLGQKLGHDAAMQVLRQHWDTWVTFSDFQRIANAGLNLVRIPIGFWAYETFGEPFVQGAAPYLDAAIDWARATGLKVIIDLHGAPRSQNGFDNSGQRSSTPGWQGGDSVKQTVQVLHEISQKYAHPGYSDVVVAIQLLNEPLAPRLDINVLKQFYRDGYGQVREQSPDTVVVLHDAFLPPSSWNGFLTPSDNNAQRVAIDHHEYQVFDNGLVAMAPWQHRQLVCNNAASYSGSDKWSFVGEWTAAMTDCAFALNGYGVGARYDGSYTGSSYIGSCADINFIETWDQTLKDDTRGYIEAQLDTYEKYTGGWVFWNFKTEQSAEWDLFRLLDSGVFPQPLTDRKFGPVCT